jgi:hypothetical protein
LEFTTLKLASSGAAKRKVPTFEPRFSAVVVEQITNRLGWNNAVLYLFSANNIRYII